MTKDSHEPKLSSLLLQAVDQLNTAKSSIQLLDLALDNISDGEEMNALQYGMAQIRREMLEAIGIVEAARSLAG